MVSTQTPHQHRTNYQLRLIANTSEWHQAASAASTSRARYPARRPSPRPQPHQTPTAVRKSSSRPHPHGKPTPGRKTTRNSSSNPQTPISTTHRHPRKAPPSKPAKKTTRLKINWNKHIAMRQFSRELSILCENLNKVNHLVLRNRGAADDVAIRQYDEQLLEVCAAVVQYKRRFLS